MKFLCWLILLNSLFIADFIYSEDCSIELMFLNGDKKEIGIHDSIDEIDCFKTHMYLKSKGTLIQTYTYYSPIINIAGLSKISNLKKASFIYVFIDVDNLDFLESKSLETLFISSGIILKDMYFLEKLPGLKILGLNWINFEMQGTLDLSKTDIIYFELSDSELSCFPDFLLPDSLRYINLHGNNITSINQQICKLINDRGITIILDNRINCLASILSPEDFLNESDEKYTMKIP